ncbi:hypothetical protein DU500_09195 [Haloplanus rubicundus]|uniref:Uncharacterized protein n=1 Tax=Haloplanus rubicundus TaxID=1547898 RepID=A0A345E317_9EURY|nr:hypothetical protein [Haloplanus rubicundus]AXG06589.1 hypothetical protein DU500_09195 [Haloplanus rubicundus]
MSRADSRDVDEFDVGDVIVIDRSVGEIQSRTFASVVAIGARGPRIVGPSYPVVSYANALKIDGKTKYDRIVGRDDTGAYHLLRRDHHRDGTDVLDVVEAPGSDPEYRQAIADDEVLALWIEHVDDKRGWESVAQQFIDMIEGGDER